MKAHNVWRSDCWLRLWLGRKHLKCQYPCVWKDSNFHISQSYTSITEEIPMLGISILYINQSLLCELSCDSVLLILAYMHQVVKTGTPSKCMFLQSISLQPSEIFLIIIVHECISCIMLVHIMYDLYCFRLIKMGHLQVVPFYPHFCPKSMFFPSYSIAIQSNCNQMTLIDTTTHDTCMVWILKRLRISSEQTSNRLSWVSPTLGQILVLGLLGLLLFCHKICQ